jgi:hypothetical protein
MAVVGCVVLDWDGLAVTAERGDRRVPVRKANGDYYQMVMMENAPDVSVRALYWGSHNTEVADGAVWFTSFGDHETPRRLAFPDFGSRIGVRALSEQMPARVAEVLAPILRERLSALQAVGGRALLALRDGPAATEALASRTAAPVAETQHALELLEALLYVKKTARGWALAVPVFTARDRAFLDEARNLGRSIVASWLEAHAASLRRELADLSSLRAGVAYEELFTQVWHDLFGWTNYHLARDGFLYDAYGPNAVFVGFLPFVWDASLKLNAGTALVR